MGEVYRARDTRLERSVAVKVLPAHLSANSDFKARFEREARAISSLSHPHICTLHDIGQQDGMDFLVMELVEGETLEQQLGRAPLPPGQTVRYGAQIADASSRRVTWPPSAGSGCCLLQVTESLFPLCQRPSSPAARNFHRTVTGSPTRRTSPEGWKCMSFPSEEARENGGYRAAAEHNQSGGGMGRNSSTGRPITPCYRFQSLSRTQR